MKKIVCIYHENCSDGFTAAWVVHRKYRGLPVELEFIPMGYHNRDTLDIESLKDVSVYIVDFSFDKETTLKIAEVASEVIIFDHHKTAIDELSDLLYCDNIHGTLDDTRSGCQITWDELFTGYLRPKTLRCIGDRDIWKFEDDTDIITSAVFMHEQYFEVWDELMTDDGYRKLRQEGEILIKKRNKDVQTIINGNYVRPIRTTTGSVFLVNAPHFMASDVCNTLLKERRMPINPEELAIAFYVTNDGTIGISVRSDKHGISAEAFCKGLGGGGHRNAAGASGIASLDDLLNYIKSYTPVKEDV